MYFIVLLRIKQRVHALQPAAFNTFVVRRLVAGGYQWRLAVRFVKLQIMLMLIDKK